MLRYHFDLLVRNQAGNLIAIVEIKNPKNLSLETARAFLHQVVEAGERLEPRYVLLVSQDTGYVWKHNSPAALDQAALLQFPMSGVLARYTDVQAGRRLTEAELGLRIRLWLTDLSLGLVSPDEEPERALASIGFLEAMRDATVTGDADVW